ncbi:MAG: glycosyltransferase family 2 protein [Parcubacteria group bacterium]
MKKLPISIIVTTYNEEYLLAKCLSKLTFCDELLVVDLGSNDNSVEIARKYASKIIQHKKVPYVEKILVKFVPKLKNEWVMHIDPDEVLDENLIDEIKEKIKSSKSIAIIRIPWVFYYKGKKIKGTVWGGKKYKRVIYNKKRVKFKDLVHNGSKIIEGDEIKIESNYALHHYWMNSYSQLLEKHKRYIKAEGKKRFANNERYSLQKKIKESTKSLIKNLILSKGIMYGPRSIFLSFFHVWYVWQSNNSLRKYEKNKYH